MRPAIFARVVLLPLALVVGTVAGVGSYYEASDDTVIAWLFSGKLALGPVPALPLYFHGYGHVLAALYAAAPGVAWFGLLLAGLLGVATVFAFAVLDRLLRPHVRPGWLVLALVGFFGVAWLEHWLWFSYVRVALLLAGTAVLYAAQRPGRREALALGLLGLGAAWLMRPSQAVMSFGAVLPAALALAGGWRRARPVLLSGALLLALATAGAGAWRTPAQAHTQTLDSYLARVLDFNQLQPRPRTPADSLGVAATDLWLLGDATIVDEAFFRRVYSFNAAAYFTQVMPAKLALSLILLVRDFFPVLLALLATVAWPGRPRRAWFWLVQAGFVGALLLLAGLLKLPPRLALPLLNFWLITNLALVLPFGTEGSQAAWAAGPASPAPAWRRAAVAVALVVFIAYGAKTWHRRLVLGQERGRHLRGLAAIGRAGAGAGAGRVCILAGGTELLKSLSPFRTYSLGAGPLLMLSGWPSHDASQVRLRQALSGAADQTECLRRLATAAPASGQPGPLWVLTPETAAWLNRRFELAAARVRLVPGAALPSGFELRWYRPQPASGPMP